MKVIREGDVTLPSGVKLERAVETECGCIFGVDKANGAFVILPHSQTCEVYTYATRAATQQKKPIGMMVEGSRKDYGELVRKMRRHAPRGGPA